MSSQARKTKIKVLVALLLTLAVVCAEQIGEQITFGMWIMIGVYAVFMFALIKERGLTCFFCE